MDEWTRDKRFRRSLSRNIWRHCPPRPSFGWCRRIDLASLGGFLTLLGRYWIRESLVLHKLGRAITDFTDKHDGVLVEDNEQKARARRQR